MFHYTKFLTVPYLIQTFILGIFFVLAYLRTSNLYVSIFIHGLIDYHDPLFYPKEIIPYTENIANLVQFYALIALMFWSWITKNGSENNKEILLKSHISHPE
ncbi:CPBP family glutamic-type intramembrane protease [Geobacillus jurassicus]|uniref:Type II CAAX prenyl endopeptidase Rce1 family protein n=1 Tax=Geobacillus jurassicus TaxID=235932 RepID=A0ABV6GXK0_9BACL